MGKKFVDKKFGVGTLRRDYSKVKNELEVENLLQIQLKDFNVFLENGFEASLQHFTAWNAIARL